MVRRVWREVWWHERRGIWCRVMECGIVSEVLWGMKRETEGREKRFEKVRRYCREGVA